MKEKIEVLKKRECGCFYHIIQCKPSNEKSEYLRINVNNFCNLLYIVKLAYKNVCAEGIV